MNCLIDYIVIFNVMKNNNNNKKKTSTEMQTKFYITL